MDNIGYETVTIEATCIVHGTTYFEAYLHPVASAMLYFRCPGFDKVVGCKTFVRMYSDDFKEVSNATCSV